MRIHTTLALKENNNVRAIYPFPISSFEFRRISSPLRLEEARIKSGSGTRHDYPAPCQGRAQRRSTVPPGACLPAPGTAVNGTDTDSNRRPSPDLRGKCIILRSVELSNLRREIIGSTQEFPLLWRVEVVEKKKKRRNRILLIPPRQSTNFFTISGQLDRSWPPRRASCTYVCVRDDACA